MNRWLAVLAYIAVGIVVVFSLAVVTALIMLVIVAILGLTHLIGALW